MFQLGAILSFGANIGCILVHYTKSGVSTMRETRKDIQYAHSSGAQIHEDPQSRFCFFSCPKALVDSERI